MALSLVLFLALLQGASELFPISSLGHSVLIPALFNLGIRQSDADFVPLLVLLHLGTAGALLILYWRDWRAIISGGVRAALRGSLETQDEKLAMLLVVGTIPAGILGVLFEHQFKHLFATPRIAAAFLIVNGAILAGSEVLRRRDERRRAASAVSAVSREQAYTDVEHLSFRTAVVVGICQASALLPGISRAGVTMSAGLMAGLSHQQAARFAFLLATPIILAAGLLEVPQLAGYQSQFGAFVLGAVVAGAVAYVCARFLLRYLKTGRLDPFAAYCAALGIIGVVAVH